MVKSKKSAQTPQPQKEQRLSVGNTPKSAPAGKKRTNAGPGATPKAAPKAVTALKENTSPRGTPGKKGASPGKFTPPVTRNKAKVVKVMTPQTNGKKSPAKSTHKKTPAKPTLAKPTPAKPTPAKPTPKKTPKKTPAKKPEPEPEDSEDDDEEGMDFEAMLAADSGSDDDDNMLDDEAEEGSDDEYEDVPEDLEELVKKLQQKQKTPEKAKSPKAEKAKTPKAEKAKTPAKTPKQQAKPAEKAKSPKGGKGDAQGVAALNEDPKRTLNARSLFVKGLAADTSVDAIKALSKDIVAVRLRMDKRNTSKCRGFGYIEFKSEATADKGLKTLQGKLVGKEKLVVDYVGDKSKNRPKAANFNKTLNSRKLYISGLSPTSTEQDVTKLFPKASEVTVPIRKSTGHTLGYGFVSFGTEDAAKKAQAATQGKQLNGQVLSVMFSYSDKTGQKSKAAAKRKSPSEEGPASKKSKKKQQEVEEEEDSEGGDVDDDDMLSFDEDGMSDDLEDDEDEEGDESDE